MTKLPSWLNRGDYWLESSSAPKGGKRAIRALNNHRTHNIDLEGATLYWESCATGAEGRFVFESVKAAKAWWATKFGGCQEITTRTLLQLR